MSQSPPTYALDNVSTAVTVATGYACHGRSLLLWVTLRLSIFLFMKTPLSYASSGVRAELTSLGSNASSSGQGCSRKAESSMLILGCPEVALFLNIQVHARGSRRSCCYPAGRPVGPPCACRRCPDGTSVPPRWPGSSRPGGLSGKRPSTLSDRVEQGASPCDRELRLRLRPSANHDLSDYRPRVIFRPSTRSERRSNGGGE